MLIRVEDNYGLAVLRDTTLSCPVPTPLGKARHSSILEPISRRGDIFFIDGEDPIGLSIELLVEGEIPSEISPLYETVGGTFLLRAPSGHLALSGLESWASASPGTTLQVRPGDYAVSVFAHVTHDLTEHCRKLEALVGPANWAYRNRADKLAFLGCLPTLAIAPALLVPPWRRFALYVLAAGVLSWLPHVVLRNTRRYRNVERQVKEFEAALPSFFLILVPVQDTTSRVGGHVAAS